MSGKSETKFHNGANVKIVVSPVDSLLTVMDVPGNWEGKYVCRFMYQNVDMQVSYGLKFPLNPQGITRNPTQVSIIKNSMSFSGVTFECCVLDNGQSFSVFWEPGHTASGAQKINGQMCYTFTLMSVPEKDTLYRCVFQDDLNQIAEAEINVMVIQANDIFCPDNFFVTQWNATKAGQIAEMLCSEGKKGNITRTCSKDGQWGKVKSRCLDTQLLSTLEQAKSLRAGLGKPEIELPGLIVRLRAILATYRDRFINDSLNIISVVNTIKSLSLTAMDSNVQLNTSAMKDLVAACSALLDLKTVWSDVRDEEPSIGATLMHSLENMTRCLEPNGESFNISTPNILFTVKVLSPLMSYNTIFNITSRVKVFMRDKMPEELVEQSSIRVTSMMLRNLTRILPPNIGEEIEGSDHMIKNLILINTVVGNNVSVTSAAVEMNFGQKSGVNDTSSGFSQCVFWDYRLFEGVGGWSTEGCNSSSKGNAIICTCDHLTPFSVLYSSLREDSSLNLVSQIGEITSITCLIISIIIHIVELWFEYKNKISFFRHITMINIALSLLIADSWLLASFFFKRRHGNHVCIAAAFFNHLFYLAACFWMLFQGLILFNQIVFVFHQLSKRTLTPIMLVMGYFCPFVIAVVTLAIYYPKKTYIKDGDCLLNEENGAMYAFSGPVLIIIVMNIVILTVVIVKLLIPSDSEGPEGEDKEALLAILKELLMLIPVFGLTWMLEIITLIMNLHNYLYYIFNLLNSFQGVFILLFGCLLDKKVRDFILKMFKNLRALFPALSRLSCRRGKNSYSMDEVTEQEFVGTYKTQEK